VPEEYFVMKLCEKFHCLPDQIRAMSEADFQMLVMLMSAEAEAGRLKAHQTAFYGKRS
jgi:hypothetical protein